VIKGGGRGGREGSTLSWEMLSSGEAIQTCRPRAYFASVEG